MSLSTTLFNFASPFLMKKDPEEAHHLTLLGLKYGSFLLSKVKLGQSFNLMGLDFPNRLGVAAGFDKNAIAIDGLFKIGFGFVEIGTVTPLPQIGNEKPRLFRLKEDMAVINRMGFNNDGAEIVSKRLKQRLAQGKFGIVGVNIGANKDSEDKIKDYAVCANYFLDTASYFTVNVSSPNTQGLRDLQKGQSLLPLLDGVLNVVAKSNRHIPVLLKIAPDLMQEDLEEIADIVAGLNIAGIITTNTTISRPSYLTSEYKEESGGLSGRPLFDMSTEICLAMRALLPNDKVVIGAGGVYSADTAMAKRQAGADLVQLYSCLVYKGPALIEEILQNLE